MASDKVQVAQRRDRVSCLVQSTGLVRARQWRSIRKRPAQRCECGAESAADGNHDHAFSLSSCFLDCSCHTQKHLQDTNLNLNQNLGVIAA
jgi:hypothetical protein